MTGKSVPHLLRSVSIRSNIITVASLPSAQQNIRSPGKSLRYKFLEQWIVSAYERKLDFY
jgi:hypothetical protein